jgi:hypothetical protein
MQCSAGGATTASPRATPPTPSAHFARPPTRL